VAGRTCVRVLERKRPLAAATNAPAGFHSRPRVTSLRAGLLRLPEPMLARAGAIPTGAGWRFEPKLDGFRCLVCTHDGRFRARGRRGLDLTPLLPELAAGLPGDVQLDGELVALNGDGEPDYQLLCDRMLHRRAGVPVTYMVFDVLAFEAEPTTSEPYRERRKLLEALPLQAPLAGVLPTFTNGEALFATMCERNLEGVVAKREGDVYRPGDRGWVKVKNHATTRRNSD
jgi:bifunctional non-homologous end joining protein LigD